MVGYVTKVDPNFSSPSKAKYYKFIVDNGKGRKIQVTAWNQNIPVVNKIYLRLLFYHINNCYSLNLLYVFIIAIYVCDKFSICIYNNIYVHA